MKTMTIEMPEELVVHLDRQARRFDISRAAYLRRVVKQDRVTPIQELKPEGPEASAV
jgi:predicted transcriptional regulator